MAEAVLIALVVLLPCLLLYQISAQYDQQREQSDSTSSVSTVAAWETTHDLSVHYHVIVLNLIPYTDDEADSSGTSFVIRGRYSDATSFTYPLCTFTRVCLTSSHVLLSFHNLTVHTFYSIALPYCHDRLYRRFSICGCFHSGYRPVVMPYALEATEEERADAKRVAMSMVQHRFGFGDEWTRDGHSAAEQVAVAREIPTVDEMAALPHSSPRLYADPFVAAAVSSSSVPASDASFSFRYAPSHYYSIHKWVNLHHIAHWAQKLLVMQATLGHYHHACRHAYRRLQLGEWSHWEGIEREKNGPHVTVNGRAEVEELMEEARRPAESQHSPGAYRLECLPELSGVLCHDTYSPLYEHEENIMDISVHALSDWVDELGDDVDAHSPSLAHSPSTHWMSLHPSLPASRSLPAAFSTSFSHSSSVLFTNDLFTVYSADYLSDIEKWNRQLPSPTNVHTLSCVARVSFSPLFGTFVDNAYDAQQWRNRAMRHYGLKEHKTHTFREVEIPVVSDFYEPTTANVPAAGGGAARRVLAQTLTDGVASTTPVLTTLAVASSTHNASTLPSSASITHSATAAVSMSSCPPSTAILIFRADRAILNQGELLAHLKQKYNLLVHPTAISGSTSSADQARIFASAGLILSPHSSQLVNVMFAHSSAAVIEVTGEYYNLDFARYATSMGVYFRYAIGGHFPGATGEPDQLMVDCVSELHQCAGDNWCIAARAERYCRQYSFFPNKPYPYHANITAVDIAVRHALGHLVKHCYGRWQDVKLTSLP